MHRLRPIFSAALNISKLNSAGACKHDPLIQENANNLVNHLIHDCVTCSSVRMVSSNANSSSSFVPKKCSNSLSPNGRSTDLLQTSRTSNRFRSVLTAPKMVDVSGTMEDPKLLSKDEREEFMSMFPDLVKDLVEQPELKDMEETNQWMTRVLQYNVPHGKRNRGLITALAYRHMENELTEENIRLSYVLGWCIEILQAYFLLADDIMDDSETRRGRLCWYRVDNLGAAAFNDALLLESAIYQLLKKHFRDKKCYVEIMDIFHDINMKTTYGQSLDTRTGLERKIETYNMERYSGIVKYKTSFYSFYGPVRLAMALAGISDPELIRQVEKITLEMGHLFQVQDDFLDCFGDESVTGKVGTDIQDCKCSWLFVVAMQNATPQQKEYLKDNYGQNDQEKIDRVKNLYRELGVPNLYSVYEENTYTMICNQIQQMSHELPKQLFVDMLLKIYRRRS